MQHVIERIFHHAGLECAVVMQSMGHRCGYVGVPDGHPAYGLGYDDDNFEAIEVHGGLTYADYHAISDLWWLGFDCAHVYDQPDRVTASRYFSNDKEAERTLEAIQNMMLNIMPKELYHVWTLEEVAEECKRLAEQLVEMA